MPIFFAKTSLASVSNYVSFESVVQKTQRKRPQVLQFTVPLPMFKKIRTELIGTERKETSKANVTTPDHHENPFFNEPEHPNEEEVLRGSDEDMGDDVRDETQATVDVAPDAEATRTQGKGTVKMFMKSSLDWNNQPHIPIHGQEQGQFFQEQEESNDKKCVKGMMKNWKKTYIVRNTLRLALQGLQPFHPLLKMSTTNTNNKMSLFVEACNSMISIFLHMKEIVNYISFVMCPQHMEIIGKKGGTPNTKVGRQMGVII